MQCRLASCVGATEDVQFERRMWTHSLVCTKIVTSISGWLRPATCTAEQSATYLVCVECHDEGLAYFVSLQMPCVCFQPAAKTSKALFNPKTSILIQKRHPYTGKLNSETSGDSRNAFLPCGDVSGVHCAAD